VSQGVWQLLRQSPDCGGVLSSGRVFGSTQFLENCSRNFSEAMAPSQKPSTERRRINNESAATVRIPEYYADAPMAWFCSINATFAVSRVTKPITKFH
jgi:hypothetical protein